MTLIEIDTLLPFDEGLFTPREKARGLTMAPRRRRGFHAARVALKRLARQLGLVKAEMPDRAIETLGPDEVRPCLGESGLYCSVSHTMRFVVAVAHVHPIGVDLEAVSGKPLRASKIFLSQVEQAVVYSSGEDPERTATRAWTVKEAAAKALGLDLFEAIRKVEVVGAGEEEGAMRYQGRLRLVRHAEGDGHVIAMITCDDL